MPHFIFKETRRDRAERLFGAASRSPHSAVSGSARNIDEAVEVGRELEHTREGFTKPLNVEGGPERRLAFEAEMLRIGQDPDKVDRQWHGTGKEAERRRMGKR